ncbi:FMN-binding negative transcriptional regulator [Leptospira idonii]|uniref:FMN-binding negative transcriptional regulator n=1 Tax=Leptospira idonii TaxID=1193500 RepID=A0A4R9M3Z8_9LEPT|nr:FMN-binding negative transcriptional regulator [Leptospira idonii]TGN20701.1 FMN-binding negative transcriptional regulator [Leptospira idonii]
MFVPSAFELKDVDLIHKVMGEYSFATLISMSGESLWATHLPLLLNSDQTKLVGHIAKQNLQWKDLESKEVLAIFQGPHAYISPSWYETDRAVPTWNYISVHVYGKARLVSSESDLLSSLANLVKYYESEDSNYSLQNVESKYKEGLVAGIVGIEIQISRIEAKAKLSQNHSVERQKLVIQNLEKSKSENEAKIAEWMKENLT